MGIPILPAVVKRMGSGLQTMFAPGKKTVLLTEQHGYPPGLANAVEASLAQFPLRFWIVDNSYSMGEPDGARLVSTTNGMRVLKHCTRTDELKDAVFHQAELSALLGARTDFIHLNRPRGGSAPKDVTLVSGYDASGCGYAGTTVSSAKAACDVLGRAIVPCGSTPLTDSVNQIHTQLAPLAAAMHAKGERAVVVIATDGLPDDAASFLQALQLLQARCPVWIIVRLCTSEESIVEYWASLDRQLERPLEVLDDVFGEAAEVAQHNDWLAYGPALHAARLFGLQHKLFDELDEREMAPSAIKQMCELLLGCGPLPEPQLDPEHFIHALRDAVTPLPLVFDPRRKKLRAWIDVDRLAARFAARARLEHLGLGVLYPCVRTCV